MDGTFTALYAIILASTMVWVETGPTDFSVWLFYALAILSVVVFARSVWSLSKEGSKASS